MIRPFTCVCFLLACGSGLYLYQAKHRVQMIDREIEKTVRATDGIARADAGAARRMDAAERPAAPAGTGRSVPQPEDGHAGPVHQHGRSGQPAARGACAGASAVGADCTVPDRGTDAAGGASAPAMPLPPPEARHRGDRRRAAAASAQSTSRRLRRPPSSPRLQPVRAAPVVAASGRRAVEPRPASPAPAILASSDADVRFGARAWRGAPRFRRRGRCRSAPRNGSTAVGGG